MVRISIHELEETVSAMVQSNQPTASVDKLVRPSWWPVDYQFPLKRHPGTHRNNWRETLRNLIAKCNKFNNSERLRSKLNRKHNLEHRNLGDSSHLTNGRVNKFQRRILANNMNISTVNNNNNNNNNIVSSSIGVRRDSTGSSNGSTVSSVYGGTATPLAKPSTRISSTIMCGGGDSSTSRREVSAAAVLAKNLGLSPFVQVYDVFKVNPTILNNNNYLKNKKNENCDDTKRDIKVEKNHFMNYFGLNLTKSDSVPFLKDTSQNIQKISTHKNNIINCPHIPFSSNVGLKLLQGWHTYDSDVVEKRLERTERYLGNNDLPTLLTPIKEEFKVMNNKNSFSRAQFNHFYIFPTKKRHRKGKLTPKARFLLTNYCKPCFVNLSKSGAEKIKKYFDSRKHSVIAFIDLTNTEKVAKQKENKTPFALLESRVVLTTIDDKFKENSSLGKTSLVEKSNRSNFALQTLAPRNENLVESTKQPTTKPVNFVNPSVVLQPIHELFEFSKRDKILNASHKISQTPYKVVKTRVNVYNPRRFSTRIINV